MNQKYRGQHNRKFKIHNYGCAWDLKSGRMIKGMIIFKGLKKIPKCKIPKKLFIVPSNKGSMNAEIMKSWITNCFDNAGPYGEQRERLLIMDEFASHKKEEIISLLKKKES